jgi:hypothetical protein
LGPPQKPPPPPPPPPRHLLSQVPVRFEVPRKGTSSFQADLYPDTPAAVPAQHATEYFSGKNSNPRMMKMDTKAVVDPLPYEPFEPVRSPSRFSLTTSILF